jgi:putative ABC transport system permease protein
MRFTDPIKISYKNLLAAKFRSFLTILGVIIGVGSVIIIMSIGSSAQGLILNQVSSVGSNLVGILPGASDENGPPAAAMGIVTTTFKYDDLEAIKNKNNVPETQDAAGYVMGTAALSYPGTNLNASFTGTTASYVDVENAEIIAGRFITSDEENNLARVAVLGSKLAVDLFGSIDPINKTIKIKDQSFVVIGVFKARGSTGFGMSSQDDTVFVPLKTAQKLLLGIDYLGFARVKVTDASLTASAINNIKIVLRERHNVKDPSHDDFSVRDQSSALETIKKTTDVLRYFLLAIGTISLLVGGVGIMNIMLIAVSQRIREVGLRKAVGARNGTVMTQFLIESIFISFLGGVIGIIFGIAISYLIALVIPALGYDWTFHVPIESIFVATLVSIVIGIIFGVYPARKASKISPMEALRYE